jgi:hypothetical protein
MKNYILGAGQIAKVLEKILCGEVKCFDKGQWENDYYDCDFLHIAIPYTKRFVNIIENAERVFSPTTTVIHSTVAPGTTERLKAVYSPVLGRHDDDFENNVKMYRKFLAGPRNACESAKDQFKLTTEYWGDNTNELEYAKIMSTTRMYWDLLFMKEMQKDCEKLGYDFIQAYNRWTDNYNAGIRNNHPKWERPIYTQMESNFPGGHCLRPNIHLVDNTITNTIKAWEKDLLYFVTKEGTVSGKS